MTPKPNLTDDTPFRCNNCKRHLVERDGAFWICTRLTQDPTTRDYGCGAMFVADVYTTQQKGGDTE